MADEVLGRGATEAPTRAARDADHRNGSGLRTVHDAAELEPVATRPGVAPDTVAAVAATSSWAATLSPEADSIAFISNRSGEPRLWLCRLDGTDPTLLNTGMDPVLRVDWSPDGSWLAYLVAPGGGARTEVWALRPDGRDLHQLAGFGDASATFGQWGRDGSLLAIAEADRHTERSVASLIEPDTGRRTLLGTAEILAALDVTADRRRALLRRGPRSARWLELADVASGDRRRLLAGSTGDDAPASTDVGYFDAGGATVLARTDAGRDRAALVALPVDDPDAEPDVIAARDDAELEHFVLSNDRTTACLLWNVNGGCSDVTLLDLRTGSERQLPRLPGDVVSWCALSSDGGRLVFTAESPTDPRNIWVIDAGATAAEPVTYPPPHVLPHAPLHPELQRFHARDGLELSGWLYQAEGEGPSPTVIYLHGGPEAQDRPVFNSLFRGLVARGLTVFAPNVRGSSGFGRAFVNADNLEGRYAAITDVAAAVDHVVDAGIADPANMGCMGRSYGGYLTLAALVWYPELFRVGVDVCGMSDLRTFYRYTEPWIAAAAVSKYGHPDHHRELLHDLSPLHRMDRLRAPLLIVHGAHDTNVPLHEAEQLVMRLSDLGRPHELLLFRDEGHEILTKANRAFFVKAVGDWLCEHLQGSSETRPIAHADAV
jgi:dipeptidyl aminopeptidase/acylaminoacyl peptidase